MKYVIEINGNDYVLEFPGEWRDFSKLTFLPGHQPLVSQKHKFLYQPLTKVACKTIKAWMLG